MKYLVVDVETPNRKNNRISSFGYAVVEDNVIKNSGSYLCNPEEEFDPFNIKLTGISEDTVANAPTFPQLWESIRPLFEGAVIVAHNAKFDLGVFRKCFEAYGMEIPEITYGCTLCIAHEYWPDIEKYALNELAAKIDASLDHHNAGSDAVVCAQLLQYYISNGFDISKHIQNYAPENHQNFRPKFSEKTIKIREFLDILDEISSDDNIDVEEIVFLVRWIFSHQELCGEFQYDRIVKELQDITHDGMVNSDDFGRILSLCKMLGNPLDCAEKKSNLHSCDLDGKTFCLSGEFYHGSKEDVSEKLTSLGASELKSVSRKLNYLFVGGQGNAAWSCGNYGSKVKRALELQSKGVPIEIIGEDELFSILLGDRI